MRAFFYRLYCALFPQLHSRAVFRKSMNLLHALDNGVLDGLTCPQRGRDTVSVWFTHPTEIDYSTFFVWAYCSRYTHAKNLGRPAHFSERRVNPDLQAREKAMLATMKFPLPRSRE